LNERRCFAISDEQLELLIKKYALQNAIFHAGTALQKAVLGKVIAEQPELRNSSKELMPVIDAIVREINNLSLEEQTNLLAQLAPELVHRARKEKTTILPELEHTEAGVVMRIAPFPSGPLHIGNARMVLLNDEFVKKYGGKLYLVFDDTIGSEEKEPIKESYELITDALDWLGVKYDKTYYKSDRLELFYEWCERLVRMENAYVCECPAEKLRTNREQGIECEHRGQSAEINLEKWRAMLDGKYAEGSAIVRLKTDMCHRNPAFRDRVIFRISDREHPRVRKRYRVWPLLEFSWAVDDHLLGVSHILRGKDLIIEDEMEKYLWELFRLKPATFIHYGMLRVAEAKLSKSKSLFEIRTGEFSGWDDPRTWSLQSLRRRGIRSDAIRSFILSFGMSLTDIEVPAENLYAENRKLIDPTARRYFFVPAPVEIEIEDLPQIEHVTVPNHPDRGELGARHVKVDKRVSLACDDFEKFKGREIRLKDFCNIILQKIANFTSRENKEIPRIQWVAGDGVKVRVIMPDGSVIAGIGERALLETKVNNVVQFERFGFVRIDEIGENKIDVYFAHK
jgi:glutamyl-tRNA synthetase